MFDALIAAATAKAIGSTLQGLGNIDSFMHDQKKARFLKERGVKYDRELQERYERWRRDPAFRKNIEEMLGRKLPDYENETTYLAMAEIAESDGWTLHDVIYIVTPEGELETHYGYAYSKGYTKAYHPFADPVYRAAFHVRRYSDEVYHEIKRDVDPEAMKELDAEGMNITILVFCVIAGAIGFYGGSFIFPDESIIPELCALLCLPVAFLLMFIESKTK